MLQPQSLQQTCRVSLTYVIYVLFAVLATKYEKIVCDICASSYAKYNGKWLNAINNN